MYLQWNNMFNETILKEGLDYYGANIEDSIELEGKQNIIYSYKANNKDYIIRFSSSIRRKKSDIYSELDWLFYLYDNGIELSKPVMSIRNNFIEEIRRDGYIFFVVSFEKASGKYIKKEDRSKEIYYQVGKSMGMMHKLTKDYFPSNNIISRNPWYYSKLFNFIEMNIPKSEKIILNNFAEVIQQAKDIPFDINSCGLIHSDIHYRNFSYCNNEITFFDFDDCEYGLFIKDISNFIFYTYVENYNSKNKKRCTEEVIEFFLKGYYEENYINEEMFKYIPIFLKVREIVMYAMLYHWRHFEVCSEWVKKFMINRKEILEKNLPTINEIDFSKIEKFSFGY